MADCARCGREGGATKTEVRFTDLRVTTRLLCEGCRKRYRGKDNVADVIDLELIDAVDPLAPRGPGTCPDCGKEYADVRRHQLRVGHSVSGGVVDSGESDATTDA